MTKDKVEAGEWTPEQGITAVTLYAPIAIAGSVMFAKKLHIPSIESLRPANNMNIEASSFAKVYQG